ncbi:MAG: LysM peptidoglycan-binding domain-containing protein [Christensenellaceae bacterium]|nr:LysM peptidoglycan-binding domain-containing protein [Christensenellaceae bacterium]
MIIHTVRENESIRKIANFYGVDAANLSVLNGVSSPDIILPKGMAVLVLIPAVTHTALAGDTLFNIAERYATNVRSLLRNNPWLSIDTPLSSGQNVVISYRGEKLGSADIYSYAYPFISESLLSSVLPFLTRLAPFTYGFRQDGSLVVPNDEWMIALANDYGTAPIMHLSTLNDQDVFDSSLAVSALTDTALQQTLINNIIANMQRKGYTALDIDFEYIPVGLASNYYSFILRLSDTLNPLGYEVIVALAPKTSSQQRGLLYEAHNYSLLGRAANAVLLMTYEWGYSAGPPMAVSPINKVREVLDYAVTVIPREKIYLGISLYGYDWTLPYLEGNPPAVSLSPEEAVMLAYENGAEIQYSYFSEAPFFYYTNNSRTHEVWYEDARSIAARLKLINEYKLKGAGFWHAGRGAMQCWQTLNSLYDIKSV